MTNTAPKYVVQHAEYSAIGDHAQLNNYFPPDRAAADPGLAALRHLFEEVNHRVEALPPADREIVAPVVRQAAQAAADIQSGATDAEKQHFLETRLRHIANMAPDIGEVLIATLVKPPVGVALVISKIAQKAQAALSGKKKPTAQ